jgi:hypothetical protein
MHSNVTRLEAAGLTFDKSPGVFALSGVRGNWHLLTDDEVRGRVEWQRAKRKSSAPARPVDFNQPTQAEQDRARAEHRRHREEEAAIDRMSDQQWAAVIDRARAQWPGRHPGRPFPADPRQAVFVRAIARSFLFGPATAGVPR